MLSDRFWKLFAEKALLLKVLWGFFVITIFVLVFVAYTTCLALIADPPKTHTLLLIFSILSVFEIVFSIIVRKLAWSDSKIQAFFGKEQKESVGSDEVLSLSPREQKLLHFPDLVFVPYILSLAFHETIAIFGFVLAQLSGKPEMILPFAAVALFLDLALYSSPKQLILKADEVLRT